MKRGLTVALLLAGVVSGSGAVAQAQTTSVQTAAKEKTLLQVPAADYRKEWVQLGSFSVLADDPQQGAKQLHVVYAKPETVDAYRKTGGFPDGAVLVKDVFATKTEDLTTGRASYAGALAGRFVMVKDASNAHADKSPLWGDGWGWAFYEGTETSKTVTTDYRKDCLGCHEPVRSQDLIYTQGYPVLKR
jgi:hypothetical protein